MARIVLITGGCRSGKSAYAQRLAESLPGRRAFVATCPIIDDELRERVARHRAARGGAWHETVEEQVELAGVLTAAAQFDVVLVDCLTLWVNNLMYHAEQAGGRVGEDEVVRRGEELLAACRARGGSVIFVTNEIGMGIVPDNAKARTFRDLVGRCNQTIAAGADAVTLVACGIPVTLKGSVEQ